MSAALEAPSCTVCLNPFSERRIPFILHPCNHTFCQRCINAVLTTPRKECPLCRNAIQNSGLNYALRDAIALIAELGARGARDQANLARANLEIGLNHGMNNRNESAALYFNKVINEPGANIFDRNEASLSLAITYAHQGIYDQAAPIFRTLLLAPTTPPETKAQIRGLVGTMYANDGKSDEAKRFFNRVIQDPHAVDADRILARLHLGIHYGHLNDNDRAAPLLQQVIGDPQASEQDKAKARAALKS
jgi:tetratricopeptide (TPR) repeat protein